MATKSILDQIESGERARLITLAPDQRAEFFDFGGDDECQTLLRTGICTKHEVIPMAFHDVTPMECANGTLGGLRFKVLKLPALGRPSKSKIAKED